MYATPIFSISLHVQLTRSEIYYLHFRYVKIVFGLYSFIFITLYYLIQTFIRN